MDLPLLNSLPTIDSVISSKSRHDTSRRIKSSQKLKVGLVQVNNSFSEQSYLPLSIAFLMAYAQDHTDLDDVEFLVPIYKRVPVADAVKQMMHADLVAFSVYVWNYRISCLIAKELKKINPKITILFGGCHVPDNSVVLEKFMKNLPFVDATITGEGEIAFACFLDNFKSLWKDIPSLSYFENGNFVRNTMAPRLEDLNEIPSPYLTGAFDSLMSENPQENWIGLWETNRGCPFKCTFCDWGVGAKKRMADYNLDRLFAEVDWFSKHKVEFVYCCDANFGMYKERDLAITEKFVENKNKYGYPEAFSVQNTKNSTEASYSIQKLMTKSGLGKGVLLAFQSLHEPTLKAIKRANIKLQTFYDLQRRFTAEGVETFSDIVLGLPEETYETFTEGVSTLIEMGQHNRIQFNNLSVLPNAEMSEEEYRKKYGLEFVETKMINTHGSLGEWVDNIYETQQLVVSTNTLSREEWIKTRSFAYLTSFLHFDKLLQIPLIIMNTVFGIKYSCLIETFMKSKGAILSSSVQFFKDKAADIQVGGAEYCESKEWLGIWWPADEYLFIRLIKERQLDKFYEESFRELKSLVKGNCDILRDAMRLNKALIKVPFVNGDIEIELNHNVWDIYRSQLIGEGIAAEERQTNHRIIRSDKTWKTWDDWYKKVVWYGNKKGSYLYKCETF